MKFRKREKNIEARSCGENLLLSNPHTTIEIIEWFEDVKKPYCYTIAYWERGSEGYYLKFVGNRPFEIKPSLFFRIAKSAQEYLDSEFEREEKK